MKRQPDISFTSLLAKWPDTAAQTILNRRADVPVLTVLYERLSQEDDYAAESNSIKNQKAALEDYALKNGFPNILHLTDDGISGTRFDRPDFLKLMELAEAGCVGTLLIRDLSRFGRDHLRVGLYTERLRECGVRFIALLDNVDTARGEDDFTPFRNIINEWAARDSSRKVKALFKARAMEGRHVSGNFPYGYLRDPADKEKWIVDEEAAPIVRRIFDMTVAGHTTYQIADILYGEKVLIPGAHWRKLGVMNRWSRGLDDPYLWSSSTIRKMLGREEYLGHTVNFKTYKDSYKDKRRKINPKDERVLFENTHPAIVDAETWHTVQRLTATVRRPNRYNTVNPLTGVVYCADCGRKMTNHRNINNARDGHFSDIYVCANYRKRGKPICTMHYIRTAVLQKLALDAIRSTSLFAKENADEFIRLVREASRVRHEETAAAWKKRLSKNGKRVTELDGLIQRLYEDKVKGALTQKRFEILSRTYEREQETLEKDSAKLREELDRYAADSVRGGRYLELVGRYRDFSELTPQMLNEFVEKIVVHEPDKSNGSRQQDVEIYLNFIGKFAVPETYEEPNTDLTGAEQEARMAAEEKRARQRAYNRKYYAKKRLERLAKEQALKSQADQETRSPQRTSKQTA